MCMRELLTSHATIGAGIEVSSERGILSSVGVMEGKITQACAGPEKEVIRPIRLVELSRT